MTRQKPIVEETQEERLRKKIDVYENILLLDGLYIRSPHNLESDWLISLYESIFKYLYQIFYIFSLNFETQLALILALNLVLVLALVLKTSGANFRANFGANSRANFGASFETSKKRYELNKLNQTTPHGAVSLSFWCSTRP